MARTCLRLQQTDLVEGAARPPSRSVQHHSNLDQSSKSDKSLLVEHPGDSITGIMILGIIHQPIWTHHFAVLQALFGRRHRRDRQEGTQRCVPLTPPREIFAPKPLSPWMILFPELKASQRLKTPRHGFDSCPAKRLLAGKAGLWPESS
jgi:hypothetical protein